MLLHFRLNKFLARTHFGKISQIHRWMTDALTWPSLYDICCKCQLNLTLREQPLLSALDVIGVE